MWVRIGNDRIALSIGVGGLGSAAAYDLILHALGSEPATMLGWGIISREAILLMVAIWCFGLLLYLVFRSRRWIARPNTIKLRILAPLIERAIEEMQNPRAYETGRDGFAIPRGTARSTLSKLSIRLDGLSIPHPKIDERHITWLAFLADLSGQAEVGNTENAREIWPSS